MMNLGPYARNTLVDRKIYKFAKSSANLLDINCGIIHYPPKDISKFLGVCFQLVRKFYLHVAVDLNQEIRRM